MIRTLCNSHGRRQFVDVLAHFPDEVDVVLHQYKLIWVNDTHATEQGFTPAQRLAYHREHSLPVMERIRDWGQTQLDTEQVEANSGLGKAIRYFLNHYDGLTRFCTVEGALLDNNPCRWREYQQDNCSITEITLSPELLISKFNQTTQS